MNRLKEIKKLRSKGLTYREIGKKYGISIERVRQILNPPVYKFCKKHNRKYIKICVYCETIKKYEDFLSLMAYNDWWNVNENEINKELKRLSKIDRSKKTTIERVMFIKKAINSFGKGKVELAKLLKRHRTTINYLYEKKI